MRKYSPHHADKDGIAKRIAKEIKDGYYNRHRFT